jgi:hypothetical protein
LEYYVAESPGRLKNLALKRIPDYAGTARLAEALARAREFPPAPRVATRPRNRAG